MKLKKNYLFLVTVFLKRIFILFLFSILFIRCAEYQYATVRTDNPLNSSLGETIIENDSFRVSYFFSGEEGPARFHIYNKLDVPFYINWDSSSLKLKPQTTERLLKNTLDLNDSESKRKIQWHRKMSESADSAELTWGERITTVSPRSEIASDVIYLGSKFFRPANEKRNDTKDSVTRKVYTKIDSPFRFESHLAVSFSEDSRKFHLISNDFWVAEVYVTEAKPRYVPQQGGNNVYFIRQQTFVSELAGGLAIVGGVVVLAFNYD